MSVLLLETGDKALLETGDSILLEVDFTDIDLSGDQIQIIGYNDDDQVVIEGALGDEDTVLIETLNAGEFRVATTRLLDERRRIVGFDATEKRRLKNG